MDFTIFQETRKGARANNQDKVGYLYTTDSLLMIVCDGMGGHHRGDIASDFVVQYVAGAYRQQATPRVVDPGRFLRRALLSANTALVEHAVKQKMEDVPRTTCVCAVVQDGKMTWAHVGDSRMYHFRGETLLRKTIDHSQVQLMIEAGLITEDEAAAHPERNKIFNCLGQSSPPRVDIEKGIALQAEDIVLLATDGLWGPVPSTMLADLLIKMPLRTSVPWVMDLAETYAGRECDNLSAVAMKWIGATTLKSAKGNKTDKVTQDEGATTAITDSVLAITLDSIRSSIVRAPVLQAKHAR